MIRPLIDDGKVALVEGAPSFTYPAYAVYPEDAGQRPDVYSALAILWKYLSSEAAVRASLDNALS
jgi:hypothetical protein